jgi:hypothetical protein
MSRDMAIRPPSDPRTRLLSYASSLLLLHLEVLVTYHRMLMRYDNSDEEDREQDMRYYFEYYQYAAYKERQKGGLAKRAFKEATAAVAGSLFAASFTYVTTFLHLGFPSQIRQWFAFLLYQ